MRNDTRRLSQSVRLADVFIIGPLMVRGAVEATSMPKGFRAFLAMAGIATVLYNGINFIKVIRER